MTVPPLGMHTMGHSRPIRDPKRPEVRVGIPAPSALTSEQYDACQRFGVLVFGEPLFDSQPSHNGRHGYGCEFCVSVLAERDRELERVQSIAQPWDAKAA